MSVPASLLDLAQRFIDDRESLADDEWQTLVEGCRTNSELLAIVHEQLLFDHHLSSSLASDRQHFTRQVEQRVDDFLRGEAELTQQAIELRSLAMERYELVGKSQPGQRGMWWAWGLTLSVALLLAVGGGYWWQQETRAIAVTVAEVEGKVVIRRFRANDQYAKPDQMLQPGDTLLVQYDARATLRYRDGTLVELSGETQANVPDLLSAGKQLYLATGELSAEVAPQPAERPMIFTTPHAQATVVGTRLRLKVRERETQLDVAEGKVQLAELKTHDALFVETAESALAIYGERVVKQGVSFPAGKEGLAYLFAGRDKPILATNGRKLVPSGLTPTGENARFTSRGNMELSGGRFHDEAGRQLLTSLHNSRQYSLEILFSPEVNNHDRIEVIAALGSDLAVEIALVQRGSQLFLVHDAGSRPTAQWLDGQTPALELTSVPEAKSNLHLIVSYQPGTLVVAREGIIIARRSLSKSFAAPIQDPARLCFGRWTADDDTSAWQGRIAGFALYSQALTDLQLKR